MHCAQHICLSSSTYNLLLFLFFFSLSFLYLRITKVYESETYDYPVQIQESISELSSSIGYNITTFAASNLKGTNLPVPAAPSGPPRSQHKTLPHALSRASHTAAGTISQAISRGGDADKLSKALALYASGWDKVAAARLDQDAAIQENFLHPWQTTLNASIAVAMKARQAVRVSRLELDAAKQSYVFSLIFFINICFTHLFSFFLDLKVSTLLSKNKPVLKSRMRRTIWYKKLKSLSH